MKEKKVYEHYVNSIQNGDNLNNLLYIAGLLSEKGHPEASYVQAQSLFLNEQYEDCIQYCKSKRSEDNYAINEFYIASLMHKGMYGKVREEITNTHNFPISKECLFYILSYMEKRDERLLPRDDYRVRVANYESSDFKRILNEYYNSELIAVYEKQKDALELAELGAGEETLKYAKKELLKTLKCIHVTEDEYKKIITNVENGRAIDPIWIYNFYLKGFTQEQLRDIIRLIDLERRLGLYIELNDTILKYKSDLIREINRGNAFIANYMMEVVLVVEEDPDILSFKGRIAVKRCGARIAEAFPDIYEYGKNKAKESDIYTLLTERSRKMMEAAIWQYKAVETDETYGFRDAGMYCLSYIRLLELEMNERIIPVLRTNGAELKDLLATMNPTRKEYEEKIIIDLYKNLPENDQENKILAKWRKYKKEIKKYSFVWGNLDKVYKANINGLTAGEWNLFFKIFSEASESRKQEEIYKKLRECLDKNVFNENGMQALDSGKMAAFFDKEVVEKFRNPPAHTRYVMRESAKKCKSFVESTILELSTYYK